MPNPEGTTRFVKEAPYGARKKLEELQKSAVLAGSQGSSSAINTPKRAQRKAAKGERDRAGGGGMAQAGTQPIADGITGPAGVPEGATIPPDTTQLGDLPYAVRLYNAWTEIAQTQGASEIAQIMANRARELMDAQVS